MYYWSNGQLDKALAIIPALVHLAKKHGDNDLLGKAYYNAGVVNGMTGNTDSAIYFFKSSLALNLEDSSTIFSNYVGLGNIYDRTGDYDSSFYYSFKAARFAELSSDHSRLGLIYSNIGARYIRLQQYDDGEKYINKGLEFARKYKDYSIVAQDLSRLSSAHFLKGDYDEALKYLDKASVLLDSIGDFSMRTDLYKRYGMNYEFQGKYDLAMEYYFKAVESSSKEIDPQGMIYGLDNIAALYTKLGKHDMARTYMDSSMNIARKSGYLRERMYILYSQAENSYETGKYKQSYNEMKAYFYLYDSLNKIEKTKVINEIKQKYEKENDRSQILALEKETLKRTLQRNLFLFNSSALLVAGLFLWVILRHKLVKTRLIAQHKIQQLEEQEKIVTARKLLEGQEMERKRIAMELHDGLGVMLSATKMQFAAIQDNINGNYPSVEKAVQILEQATHEVRRISHNMMPGLLTKLGLYEAVEDLFDNVNEMENIHASVEVEGARSRLPENIEIMIYRIIQEMVNNTLKYANARNIELSIKISNPSLIIKYKDDGIGFEMDRILKSDKISLGLKSIESRVGFLNGELKIDSSPGNGVSYQIKVPVKA
jgi:signal transduction histidine kinase